MYTSHSVAALVFSASLAFGALALAAEQGDKPIMVVPDELSWTPVASMKNAQMAVIDGDPSKAEPFVIRLKLPANSQLQPHTHPTVEQVTVLSGTLHLAQGDAYNKGETKALPAGSVAIMPAGKPMFGYTEDEVVVQLNGTGPWGIDYVDPKDDPRQH